MQRNGYRSAKKRRLAALMFYKSDLNWAKDSRILRHYVVNTTPMTAVRPESHTDPELIAMICAGSPKQREMAWEIIYLSNREVIRTMVQKMQGSPDDFKDIYHDAFSALKRNIETGKFKLRASISTYLYRICYNQCCKRFRAESKVSTAEEIFAEAVNSEEAYDHTRDTLLGLIARTINEKLKPECQEILVKFYFDELSVRELLSFFPNLRSEQAVKNKKSRCLQYLRKAIENMGINPEILRV